MISLEAVSKRYPDGLEAVKELTLEIPEGEICMLVGSSGSGKTTTLKMINRLIEPSSGRILVGGQDVTHGDPVMLRLGMGYVIQQVGLFPHLTVADNVATVPRILGWDRGRIKARVAELLELVGLDPDRYRDRYPSQLSGGQRQRVGVARALGADPPILLMDEPFGAVDRVAREHLQTEFQAIQQRMRKTVVFVTHDIDEAIRLGDRIALLSEGGVLEQYDTPERVLARPAGAFVREFLGPERALKRLSVTPIDRTRLVAGEVPDGGPRMDARGTLGDALTLMLQSGTDRVQVVEEERPLGLLTLRHLLDSVAEMGEPGLSNSKSEGP